MSPVLFIHCAVHVSVLIRQGPLIQYTVPSPSPPSSPSSPYSPVQLLSIISKILAHMHNFSDLFAMDRFLPFVDLLQKDTLKVEACKSIANAFLQWQKEPTNDPVILNAMLYVCKVMHNNLK